MAHKSSRTRFWTILAIINIAAMIYPVGLYFQAEGGDSQFVATVVMLCVVCLLAIMDTVSILAVYMGAGLS